MPDSSTKRCSTHLSGKRPPFVVLYSDGPDWHARTLSAALAKTGIGVVWSRYETGGLDGVRVAFTPDDKSPLDEAAGRPWGVIARCIARGGLEQITMRLNILHAWRESGCRVFNDARAIERTVDKGLSSFLLARAGLPVPETLSCEDAGRAASFVEAGWRRGCKTVLKPLFGARGKGLRLIHKAADLPPPEKIGGVFHLQRYRGPDDPGTPRARFPGSGGLAPGRWRPWSAPGLIGSPMSARVGCAGGLMPRGHWPGWRLPRPGL